LSLTFALIFFGFALAFAGINNKSFLDVAKGNFQ
jgi:hypothetical protein